MFLHMASMLQFASPEVHSFLSANEMNKGLSRRQTDETFKEFFSTTGNMLAGHSELRFCRNQIVCPSPVGILKKIVEFTCFNCFVGLKNFPREVVS